MKKFNLIFNICAIVLLLTIVTMTLVTKCVNKKDEPTLMKEDVDIEELENLYNKGDYDAITILIRDKNLYSAKYKKYYELADTYYHYSLAEQYMTMLEGEGAINYDIVHMYVEYILNYGFIALNMSEAYFDNEDITGNEEVLEEIGNKTYKIMSEKLHMTDEEIEEGRTARDSEIVGKIAENVSKRFC